MMKSGWNRGGRPPEKKIDEGRLSALLGSGFADKLIAEQDTKLRAERERHVAEIGKIVAEELKRIPELYKKVADLAGVVQKAQAALHQAELDLSGAVVERDGFINTSQRLRRVHEMELIATAPKIIDDAITYLYELLDENQNIRILQTAVDSKTFLSGATSSVITDAPAARAWHPTVNDAIRALEAMKLDPDHTNFEERIGEILNAIPDPKNLPTVKIIMEPGKAPKTEKVE